MPAGWVFDTTSNAWPPSSTPRNRRWRHGFSPHVRRPMAAISTSGMSIWKRWCCSSTPLIGPTVASKGNGHCGTRPQPSRELTQLQQLRDLLQAGQKGRMAKR